MRMDIWKITGKGGFHFGRHGLGQEESHFFLNSDTLFAALVARLAASGGAEAAAGWTRPFVEGPPPFVLSSAFPRVQHLRFYPAPKAGLRPAAGAEGEIPVKNLKKIQFVSEGVFRGLLQGRSLAEWYSGGLLLQDGSLLASKSEREYIPQEILRGESAVWQVEQRPRVTVDRVTNSSQIYHTGRTVFAPDCGLWFGVRWLQESQALKKQLEDLLADLGDAGVGGERSSGFGAAAFTPGGTADLPDARNRVWVTLSRYLPREDEISALRHPAGTYTLENVGGWTVSPGQAAQRRRAVNLLAEGSVFGPLEREVPGRVVDTRPVYTDKESVEVEPLGHPVWRCGLALAAGFTAEGE